MADALRARLTDDLLAARKARDEVRVAVLRTTRAALGNAEAVDAATVPDGVAETPRRELGRDEALLLIRTEREKLLERSREMAALGQDDEAEVLARWAEVLDDYLV